MEDLNFIEALKKKQQKEFKMVFDEYHQKLYFFFKTKGCDSYLAEELVQETFIKLYRFSHTLNPSIKFSTQFFQIAKTTYISYYRKSKNKLTSLQQSNGYVFYDEVDEKEKAEEQKKQKLQQAIQKLPERCKQIFLLRKQENWSHAQIASHFFISNKTVENQITKAIKVLKKEMADTS